MIGRNKFDFTKTHIDIMMALGNIIEPIKHIREDIGKITENINSIFKLLHSNIDKDTVIAEQNKIIKSLIEEKAVDTGCQLLVYKRYRDRYPTVYKDGQLINVPINQLSINWYCEDQELNVSVEK